MVDLLLLKQLENLSDERVVLQFKRNPYYQYFCAYSNYMPGMPCNATELVHFRKRTGVKGFTLIVKMSVALHVKHAQEATVFLSPTVPQKKLTYPAFSHQNLPPFPSLFQVA
jgi:IS5 family transposase